MKLDEIVTLLEAEVLAGGKNLETDINDCASSDLMSDVLARMTTPDLLLSGLSNTQLIRTASLSGIKAVIMIRGKNIDQSLIDLAEKEDIILIRTRLSCFGASGLLYEKGLRNNGDATGK